jgi:nitrogen fixation protein FixH
MSWGIRITIVYVCFVALIVSMVVISARSRSELVAKDYYAQELNYQQRINAITNEKALAESIMHEIKTGGINFFYPSSEQKKDFSGELVFFRPSDSSKDVKLKLEFDEQGNFFVSKKILSKGLYKICISWKNNGKEYYKEEVIDL